MPVRRPPVRSDDAKDAWCCRRLDPPGGDVARTFVLLHGWGRTGRDMERLGRLLVRDGRILIPDLPGFGGTPMLPEGAGTEDYAAALAERIERRDWPVVRPLLLVGHSFGARVAIRLAVARPDLVDAMVLIAGAGLKRRRSPLFRLRAGILRTGARCARAIDRLAGTRLHAAYADRFGSADYRRAGPLRATFVRTIAEDLAAVAPRVRCPVLLLYGADDRETPPEFGRRYAALIPGARFEELAGFGHLDILAAGAFRCEDRIRRFLADLAMADGGTADDREEGR